MIPPLHWDELHLKAWSRLKDELFQGHVQFEVKCDLVLYENKVKTIEKIHKLNLLVENILKGVQQPSQNDHLLINVACIGMLG
jgi:hypothetical protein